MGPKSSTLPTTRITSAEKFTGPSSFGRREPANIETHDFTHPDGIPIPRRTWRKEDPPATTVGELSPDDFGCRVVIRSGEFLGTVYGTLLGVRPHANMRHFTTIQLYGKKELTFRNDWEVIVLDKEVRNMVVLGE